MAEGARLANPVAFLRVDDELGIGPCHGHGLFDEDVLLGVGGLDGDLGLHNFECLEGLTMEADAYMVLVRVDDKDDINGWIIDDIRTTLLFSNALQAWWRRTH